MTKIFRNIILPILILTLGTGCVTKYAVILVEAKDVVTNSPLSITAYSGKDGQYIGDGPPLLYLIENNRGGKNEFLNFIVESKCYKTSWMLIQVTKWSKIKSQAYDADKLNKVLFKMTPVKGCVDKS